MAFPDCEVPSLCGIANPHPADIRAAKTWAPGRGGREVTLVLHGGGWRHAYPTTDGIAGMYWDAVRFNLHHDHHTINMTYRPGSKGFWDVLAVWQRIYDTWGYRAGVMGSSAGGHFAHCMAISRQTAFSIAQGGPTDFLDPDLPDWTRQMAVDAFGEANLKAWSPYHRTLLAPTCIGHNIADTLVPRDQAQKMVGKTNVRKVYLLDGHPGNPEPDRAGYVDWSGHGEITPAARDAWWDTERTFLVNGGP